jgi:hypothetical protein
MIHMTGSESKQRTLFLFYIMMKRNDILFLTTEHVFRATQVIYPDAKMISWELILNSIMLQKKRGFACATKLII